MAQTAKAVAPAELFAVGDASKHLYADRLLTAKPAPHWIWPIKKIIAAYQTQKIIKYQKEGEDMLQKAEESIAEFREGPAVALRQEHARVASDFQEMYQNPDELTAPALRRKKHHARRSRNNIKISSEAFGARGTYRVLGGARDDNGMPSSIATVTTRSSPQDSLPKHPIIEPRAPAPEAHLLSRLERPDSETNRNPGLEGTIAWRLAQLSIVKEDPEESTSLPEGRESEPLCPGPSIAVPVAA
ncbi:hypothetical protein K466DRAFT_655250 [Polyporus arcularius HHB13444]|uniref:Uncharacterized protein n=1 Tax=Polyporus arcularius HHB13444 TaxID=1314778 RepID=A0A5C3PC28_9APHY|nr:hypothetical protein K466DRAFT_655250 [Polyporus arcularius HHB13444]